MFVGDTIRQQRWGFLFLKAAQRNKRTTFSNLPKHSNCISLLMMSMKKCWQILGNRAPWTTAMCEKTEWNGVCTAFNNLYYSVCDGYIECGCVRCEASVDWRLRRTNKWRSVNKSKSFIVTYHAIAVTPAALPLCFAITIWLIITKIKHFGLAQQLFLYCASAVLTDSKSSV